MDFWQYLDASKALDLQGISEGICTHFSELILRGHSVADLLAHYGEEFGHLPAERLRELARAHRRWQTWRRRQAQLDKARSKAKLGPLPKEVLQDAPEPHQLDAIVRTDRLCPKKEVATSEEWIGILRSGITLWTRCMQLTRKEGQVNCNAKDLDHPSVAAYDAYVRLSEPLGELAPHRWLAMRRGQREGMLELKLELPRDKLLEEVQRCQPKLGPLAAQRAAESLLQELVLDDLEAWLIRILDQEAQARAIGAASESLAGLLRAAPVQARTLGAIHLVRPRTNAAVVIVDREGDIVAQKVIRVEGQAWIEKIREFFQGHDLQQVVLPTSAPASELLTQVEESLGDTIQIIRVRAAALSEARQPLTDPPLRLSPTVAAATVLARRALDPLKEWATVDPVNIGVAEYQNDIDPDQLRAALTETVELCLLERRRGKRVSMGGGIPRGSAAMARLNPLVKNIIDLRPGMTVHGVVTNISHFGAFINIGLPQEALVHISELSDQFVSNPNDVVSIGQQVTAHVLTVDPPRGRISLSLKSLNKILIEREHSRKRPERVNWSKPSSPEEKMSKSQALANLEKLFKK